MLIVGPTIVMLLFFGAFILLVKYMSSSSHEIRVIHEEQLYNRYSDKYKEVGTDERTVAEEKNVHPIPLDQRDPIAREHRHISKTSYSPREEDETRRDSGIV